jgi:hypothetical protein
VELRYDGEEVTIYGTPHGLSRLAEMCITLARESQASEHLHLEDYQILTPSSLRGVIAVFGDAV